MACGYVTNSWEYGVVLISCDWIFSHPLFSGRWENCQKFYGALIWQAVITKWLNVWKRENFLSKEIVALHFGENVQVSLYPFLSNDGRCIASTGRTTCYGVSCSGSRLVCECCTGWLAAGEFTCCARWSETDQINRTRASQTSWGLCFSSCVIGNFHLYHYYIYYTQSSTYAQINVQLKNTHINAYIVKTA